MWFIEFQIVTKYQDIYNCGRLLHHHNSQGFHVRFYPMNTVVFHTVDLILQVLT